MKTFLYCIFSLILNCIAGAQTKIQSFSHNDIYAIDAAFPVFLGKINFNDKNNFVELSDQKRAKIAFITRSFYFKECAGDSSESYFSIRDVYFNTLQLYDSIHTLYVVLLKHMPGSALTARIVLYNNLSNEFMDTTYNFLNLSALYDYHKGTIMPSNLKKLFQIDGPEIELANNGSGQVSEYKFTRLNHNGTSNTMITITLKVKPGNVQERWTSWPLN